MKNIFIGFILIFLDFNLNINNSQIDLIPDFVGYIVMIRGINEMIEKSTFFMKVRPYVTAVAVYSGVLYLLDLVGTYKSLGVLTYILAIISTTAHLYISYNIVMGVLDMEGIYNIYLNGDRLKSIWTAYAILNVLTFMFMLFPPAAIFCIIITFIVAICFLIDFNKTKNLYYDSIG